MEARLVDLGPLPEGAVIWDVGAYKGDWSRDIKAAYPDASLKLFEPVDAFYVGLAGEGWNVVNYGLSDHDETTMITVAGDRSSTYPMGYGNEATACVLADADTVLGDQHLAVMKINVEGAEYPILERLLATDKLRQIDTLLIQFHTFIPHFGERYLAIKQGMLKTHSLAWRTPFVWERWDRR